MRNPDLDPDLEKLFREDDAPTPSTELLAEINTRIDRRTRPGRALAVLVIVAALIAVAVTIPWIADVANVLAVAVGMPDFETAVTSTPAIAAVVVVVALVAPWLWFKTVAARRE